MGKLHLPVTKAIRPLCVPIATMLVVILWTPLHRMALLLLCLTTTPDCDLTRIFSPTGSNVSLRLKAQQRYASLPYMLPSLVRSFLPRYPKLRSHSQQRPHAEPLLSSLLLLLLLLLDEASQREEETSGTVHSAPPRVRAYMHAWQQHCSTAAALGPQRSSSGCGRAGSQAGREDRQGKTIQANARRQLCVHSFDRLNHPDDRERRTAVLEAPFFLRGGIHVTLKSAGRHGMALAATRSGIYLEKCRTHTCMPGLPDWRRYHTRSCSFLWAIRDMMWASIRQVEAMNMSCLAFQQTFSTTLSIRGFMHVRSFSMDLLGALLLIVSRSTIREDNVVEVVILSVC
jgi:hypothetical protein